MTHLKWTGFNKSQKVRLMIDAKYSDIQSYKSLYDRLIKLNSSTEKCFSILSILENQLIMLCNIERKLMSKNMQLNKFYENIPAL